MRDLAERIVEALDDFDTNVETEDGREIEKLFAVHRSVLGCVKGVKHAKIDFVYQVLTEKIKIEEMEAKDNTGRTALMFAGSNDHVEIAVEIAQALLVNDADYVSK